jgi:hypothetical protein
MDYQARIAKLEHALKERGAHIKELTAERGARRALVAKISKQMENMNAAVDRWIEAFDKEVNEKGEYHWCPSLMQRYEKLVAESRRLLRDWNKFIPRCSGFAASTRHNIGRPLAASPTQRDDVLERRRAGHSLRAIAYETSLSLRTVRTITEKAGGVDRAILARLERVFPDRLAAAHERANKRLREGPPRPITEL